MMKRSIYLMSFAAILIGCARDESFTQIPSVPYQPITQAPPPTAYPPTTTPTGPTFQPSLPPGYTWSYTPFLPVDYYMRQPGYQNYWAQVWAYWQQYATQRGTNQYDFNTFWFTFCPQIWQGTQMWSMYQYINTNYYYWVQPTTQFTTNLNPTYFWQYYYGYGYGGGGTCGGGC